MLDTRDGADRASPVYFVTAYRMRPMPKPWSPHLLRAVLIALPFSLVLWAGFVLVILYLLGR